MSGSYFALNSRINNVEAQVVGLTNRVNTGVPTTSTLAQVLTNGNSAGTTDIDMNTNNINNVNTINGEVGAGALTIVGDGGISMTSNQTGITLTALVDDITIDCSTGNGVFLTSNNNTQITSTNGDINLDTPLGVVNINGVPYPPDLEAVLTAGNSANDKSIILTTTFGPLTTTFNTGSLITDGGFNLQTYDPLTITTTNGDITLTSTNDNINLATPSGSLIFQNLPISAVGLPTGAVWNNSGVLNIAP
jgi:hypothetical protein